MTIVIDGETLSIEDIRAVSLGQTVALTDDEAVLSRVRRSRDVIDRKLELGEQVYGVTTLFGAMADQYVGPEQLADVQRVALWTHKSTTGPRLPAADVRAAMLLRANSLIKGASGIRLEIIERFVTFLNAGALPHVYQRGSIGASGDLVPLSYIAGAVVGLDPSFLVDFGDETVDSHTALSRLGLEPIALKPKEGLALNNGTGACTGVAANALSRAIELSALALEIHALYAQAMVATDQSFADFIHQMKPHPGQIWTAQQMRRLLDGSSLVQSEKSGDRSHRAGGLIQDRYGIRCLPQYFGPIIDALATATRQLTTEANCANDNPLINPDTGEILHTGNFLAQYTGVAMDSVRFHIGMLAKHLDSQIALLMTPEFSNGLSASLVANTEGGLNVGFKSLGVNGNQMMPLLGFYGQSVVDRYPTHAEQYNQNINSQAMNAANLTRDALDVFEHYLAVALMIGIQAVELRAKLVADTYDAREVLGEGSSALYLAARKAAGGPPSADRPLQWNDLDAFTQPMVEGLLGEMTREGALMSAIHRTVSALSEYAGA
ncbi:HAL/PAL/TAL family ammonia-lyase [Arthrobacter sp. ZGTC412]|uniref:HAL/PAL/TAL family ammonia-lyase n=1 Tax=Arthrobacter sp. ZGTC412 TaxID=2058900 RepID=UPI000CE2D317|nr:aromatic amino acid ammonia-lyase [Arthrobacter sp. ZGTC412]